MQGMNGFYEYNVIVYDGFGIHIYRCSCRKTDQDNEVVMSRFQKLDANIPRGEWSLQHAARMSTILRNNVSRLNNSKIVHIQAARDEQRPRSGDLVDLSPSCFHAQGEAQQREGPHHVSTPSVKVFEKPKCLPSKSDEAPKSSGFETAKAGYIRNLRKDGKMPPSSFGNQKQQNGVHTNNLHQQTNESPYVHPYVNKALRGMNGDHSTKSDGHMSKKKKTGSPDPEDGPLSHRTYELLKLTPEEPLPDELARIDPMMIEQVCNEVIDSSASVAWDDIAGQEPAKRLIQEVVVWPMMNPEIFKGARAPPKGILLFGPPGTGKTLLGKAIASNIDASFFSISASSLTSKWIGDGEKMVKALFAVAGWMAPSVIFIDEIDSLLSSRKSEGEHESSRRLKTEILVQMEGCDPASSSRKVLLVGATNRPEELDEAARRRMPKQMYIPLPCDKARREMINRILGPSGSIAAHLSEADIQKIVEKTDGYSGSDMKNLIQEACQGPIREAVRSAGAKVATLQERDLRAVVVRDFAIAAKAQRASTEPSEILRYEEYNDKHGAKIVQDSPDRDDLEDEDDGW